MVALMKLGRLFRGGLRPFDLIITSFPDTFGISGGLFKGSLRSFYRISSFLETFGLLGGLGG